MTSFVKLWKKQFYIHLIGIEYIITEDITFEQLLLKSVAQSFASKLYVEKTFLHK